MEYETIQPRNWWKIVALIFIVIAIGVGGYFGYVAIYNDGYTKGFDAGSIYVVSYQTINGKVFLFNETGALKEIPLQVNPNG